MSEAETFDLTTLTVELLSAYFANNVVASEDLAGLIQSTRSALAGTSAPDDEKPDAPVHKPAVSIKKSIASADHLINLIDGKPYKTLKRHLTSDGLTIAEYKERYKLDTSKNRLICA
ncbi:MucR family transcriptional regulator [Sphingobium aromaticiconvertens]|uniref:MucR family transcriptional regulator n=1 Tax=Sphingobium aromaticiconvertens TaxID=365341 RepID=UPI003015FD84